MKLNCPKCGTYLTVPNMPHQCVLRSLTGSY